MTNPVTQVSGLPLSQGPEVHFQSPAVLHARLLIQQTLIEHPLCVKLFQQLGSANIQTHVFLENL
jgi:hypothetical protein